MYTHANHIQRLEVDNINTKAYDSSGENYHGPRTATTALPTTSQWTNISLKSIPRQILTEPGKESTNGEDLPKFDYLGYAARLITAQEINRGCGILVGSHNDGELEPCNYFMENTKYESNERGTHGYWLETPIDSFMHYVWYVNGNYRKLYYSRVYNDSGYGVRPAIEILKSDISY
ncbi:MAG: hypothetical protein PHX01_08050 [Clostridia bacterium]|nr:hypothetical protein [Clostridia bacterium]